IQRPPACTEPHPRGGPPTPAGMRAIAPHPWRACHRTDPIRVTQWPESDSTVTRTLPGAGQSSRPPPVFGFGLAARPLRAYSVLSITVPHSSSASAEVRFVALQILLPL